MRGGVGYYYARRLADAHVQSAATPLGHQLGGQRVVFLFTTGEKLAAFYAAQTPPPYDVQQVSDPRWTGDAPPEICFMLDPSMNADGSVAGSLLPRDVPSMVEMAEQNRRLIDAQAAALREMTADRDRLLAQLRAEGR